MVRRIVVKSLIVSLTALRIHIVACLACTSCCCDHCTPVQAHGAAGSSVRRGEAALGSVRLNVGKRRSQRNTVSSMCRWKRRKLA